MYRAIWITLDVERRISLLHVLLNDVFLKFAVVVSILLKSNHFSRRFPKFILCLGALGIVKCL